MTKMLNDFKTYLANERQNEIREARRKRIAELRRLKELQNQPHSLEKAFDVEISADILDDIPIT
jgi:hypothetical protein